MQEPTRRTRSRLLLGFVGLALALFANGALSLYHVNRLVRTHDAVTHTYRAIDEMDRVLSMCKDVETGTRGFVITGQESYLAPYDDAVERMKSQLAPLMTLVADDPGLLARVPVLVDQINDKLALCRQDIEIRRTQGFAASQRFAQSGVGKREMDSIRETIGTMEAMEQEQLTRVDERARLSSLLAILSLVISFLVGLGLITCVYFILARVEEQDRKLDAAYVELKRVEGMRDDLTAMLVHDLRTPLTTMLGALALLKGDDLGDLDPAIRLEMIDMSAQGGYRLLSLINELLDISKMEAGELKVRHDTVRVADCVAKAVGQVESQDMGDAARIVSEVEADLPLVQADDELLSRVLINLLGNALKFTPRNGVVTIGARICNPAKERLAQALPSADETRSSEPATVALFWVKDSGEGIPSQDLGRIFEKFGQVEARKAGRKMSTGLGLTFCRLAVEAHGGRIWVESEPGSGSSFYFTVPLRPWEEGKDPSRPSDHANLSDRRPSVSA